MQWPPPNPPGEWWAMCGAGGRGAQHKERGHWETGCMQRCPMRSSSTRLEPRERVWAQPALDPAGGTHSCLLATLINLLRASSEGIRLGGPGEPPHPQEGWAMGAFSVSPEFLGWKHVRTGAPNPNLVAPCATTLPPCGHKPWIPSSVLPYRAHG